MIELDPKVLTVLLFIAKALIGLMGFVIRFLLGEVKAAKSDIVTNNNALLKYKVEVANDYATKDFITDNFKTTNAKLDRLFEEVHLRK